ncbi:prephenate dehydratase [Geomicrobium sp. JCM 19037]|uniref:prephenate dehydratase n=1 Tax=unclassified Geomicrobium TaxID=2628951 RepID=UPI00045F2993|nr:prephenate dehydratase [Geomicrobium sp. JCM 19037]GAK05235.1 prephenate dehydratase [Geomicrobium sp. JCM 19037]
MKTAYLGPEGTFTELAAKSFLGETARVPYKDIPSTMNALESQEVDAAVVPLENTIEGSVNVTLDHLIHRYHFPIVAEVAIPIAQHLLIHPSTTDYTQVDTIYSHPHAIAQCHEFISDKITDAQIAYATSTASAAKEVSERPELNRAAIANRLAAEKYGLTIAEENIHDFPNNHTRFVLLANDVPEMTRHFGSAAPQKTKIVITLPSDYSGALHQVLSAFAWRKLNLTKIESRPTKTGIGNYYFIIDVDHAYDSILLPSTLEELKALGCETRVLGTYPSVFIEEEQETTL